jgi:hypothetical protein
MPMVSPTGVTVTTGESFTVVPNPQGGAPQVVGGAPTNATPATGSIVNVLVVLAILGGAYMLYKGGSL